MSLGYRSLGFGGTLLSEVGLWCDKATVDHLKVAAELGINSFCCSSLQPESCDLLGNSNLPAANFHLMLDRSEDFEPSLRRLQTTYVTTLLMSRPQDFSLLPFLRRQKDESRALHLGLVADTTEEALLAIEFDLDVCLLAYSWFQAGQAATLVSRLTKAKVALLAGPVKRASGLVPTPTWAVQQLAPHFDDLDQLALDYCLGERRVVSALLDCDQPQHLARLAANARALEPEKKREVERRLLGLSPAEL